MNDQDDQHEANDPRRPAQPVDPAGLPRLPKMGRLTPGGRPQRPKRPRKRAPGQIAPSDVPVLLAEAARGGPPDLTDPRVARRILRQHGLRPNKDFGQHLLADRAALDAIVEAAELEPDEAVLEVGAGMGVLTEALAGRVRRVVAVELDREILPVLRATVARFDNVEIIARNLLDVQPEAIFGQTPYKLVANLPYYITAPTLRHFLEAAARPTRLVVMVQKEVAERLVAGPGDLSLLGVSVQFYGAPRLVRVVPAASFYPPPKVDSAIVRVDVFPQPPLDPATRDLMFGIAHAGFAEKRKQLHNTLASHLSAPRETINAWLEAAAIDPKRRAETLSVDDWVRLTRAAQARPR
ncbi:MAG TPA: 16S rRNA (adenine(1518)-N(6)/adenine(1519)-N(6))-dimethyltransferase RsmA [Ktedonobacterales bacterium]